MSDVAAKWAKREARETASPHPVIDAVARRGQFKHYKPFVSAVDRYVAEAQDGERIYFGIPEFDLQIRGVGRAQLCVVNGYSHSGKTLLLAHILRHNRLRRIAWFSPDEPAQLVLAKLAALESGVPADEIEDRIANGDEDAIDILRDTATKSFPNLVVFDKPCTGEMMNEALKEAEFVWGAKCELVVFDYLELLQAGETVPIKFEFIKAFGSNHNLPVILIHQTSRSGGKDGAVQTISSGTYGGEQFATFQLGVWRKKAAIAAQLVEVRDKIARAVNGATESMLEKQDELVHEMERAEFTVTVAITKNKRPGRREGREEIDFELFGDTGQLVPLADGDLPTQYLAKLGARRVEMRQTQQPASEPSWTEEPFDYDDWADHG